jgi:hypothetical protein
MSVRAEKIMDNILPPELGVENIMPVVCGRPRTKVGRLSLRGTLNGRPVKIFEAHTMMHAAFIRDVMNDGPLSGFFPEVHAVHEKLVVCEWVPGETAWQRRFALPGSQRRKSTNFLKNARLFFEYMRSHALQEDSGFDYIEDFIRPRFEECCETHGLEDLRARVLASLQKLYDKNTKIFYAHADMTPSNAVFDENAQMKVIDNELLGTTRLPFMDELNMLQGLPHFVRRRHPDLVRPLVKNALGYIGKKAEQDIFNIWMMRQIGSWYVAGRYRDIARHAALEPGDMPLWRVLRRLAV